MNLQPANFKDRIITIYYEGTLAREAPRLIQRKQYLQLGELLRFYREWGVVCPEEIDLRTPMEALLTCYGMMEMAATAGCINPPDNSAFWTEARRILENPELKQYYTTYYPMRLPQLLLLRLQGRHTSMAKDDSLKAFFTRFFESDRQFLENLRESCLLRMLDGFKVDRYGFDDVVPLFREKNPFVGKVLLPPEGHDVRDEVLAEFGAFMRFCLNLHRLLNQLTKQPLLQSEIWNHYSYWFGTIGIQVEQQVKAVLDQFLASVPAPKQKTTGVERYVTEATTAIEDLTSNAYLGAVDEAMTMATA